MAGCKPPALKLEDVAGVEPGKLPPDVENVLEKSLRGVERVGVFAGCVGLDAKLSLASCILRLREELGIEGVVAVATPRTIDDTLDAIGALCRYCEGFRAVVLEVGDAPGVLERASRRVLEYFSSRYGDENIAVCVSPGSRRLAAALALASRDANIMHLDFWWGPWRGLPYPFIPRPLEPIYLIHSEKGLACGGPRGTINCKHDAALAWLYDQARIDADSLRACIARKAFEANMACRGVAREVFKEKCCTRCRVVLSTPVDGLKIVVDDWCEPQSWIDAAKLATRRISEFLKTGSGGIPEQVFATIGLASGFYWWVLREDGGETPLFTLRKPLLVDANLVYKGVHIEALMGARLALPWAVVAEVERGYAESLKKSIGLRTRDYGQALARLVAGLVLEELRRSAPVLPSDPPPADTAMIRMDPLILDSYTLVTEDTGAYRLWQRHPARRVASIALAQLDERLWDDSKLDARVRAARAAYAIFHTACLAEKLAALLKDTSGEKLLATHLRKVRVRAELEEQ